MIALALRSENMLWPTSELEKIDVTICFQPPERWFHSFIWRQWLLPTMRQHQSKGLHRSSSSVETLLQWAHVWAPDRSNFRNARGQRQHGGRSSDWEIAYGPYMLEISSAIGPAGPLPSHCASAVMTPAISNCTFWKHTPPLIFSPAAAH